MHASPRRAHSAANYRSAGQANRIRG